MYLFKHLYLNIYIYVYIYIYQIFNHTYIYIYVRIYIAGSSIAISHYIPMLFALPLLTSKSWI